MPEGDTIHHAARRMRAVLLERVPDEIHTPHARHAADRDQVKADPGPPTRGCIECGRGEINAALLPPHRGVSRGTIRTRAMSNRGTSPGTGPEQGR